MRRTLEISQGTECLRIAVLGCPAERICAAKAPVPKELSLRGRGRPRHVTWVKNAISLFFSALREIFDESAYARFLERNRLTASRGAYAAFLREHEVAKARRQRCC